jgi:bacteriorhodopsin
MINNLTEGQYFLIYNALSFTFAVMAAATLFVWLSRDHIAKRYRIATTITGLVTFIAAYHYMQIFISFHGAYTLKDGIVSQSGYAFNDAYRYVDWLLTVPLLMIELILVMNLQPEKTVRMSWTLSLAAAAMVILGYPGEISHDAATRWMWWTLAMIPFIYIVYTLFFGLKDSVDEQPESARGFVRLACVLTVIVWCFYPLVFILPMLGLSGGQAEVAVQVGYSIADIFAKVGFGLLIFTIAYKKSSLENKQL